MRIPDVPFLGKVALVGGVVTMGMAVAAHTKHQGELRSSTWLKHIRQKLESHPGVALLIGEPPVALGTLHRRRPTYELPSEDIDPLPLHLVTMSVTGKKGSGTLYAWLNNPTDKKIEHVDDWNVAHLELQIDVVVADKGLIIKVSITATQVLHYLNFPLVDMGVLNKAVNNYLGMNLSKAVPRCKQNNITSRVYCNIQMEDRANWPKWSPYAKVYDPLQSGSIDGTDTTPHDRALIRAMEAKFIPPNKNLATPNAENTLFVGRLDHKTTEVNLKREFSRYGTITHCRIVKDIVTGFSRGYAFVQFKLLEDAEKARRDAHHAIIDGREILVEWENGRTMPGWIPRRLGGGLCGKKESGQLRFGGRDRPFRKPIVIKPLRSSNVVEEEEQPKDRRTAEDEEEISVRTGYSRDGRFSREDYNKPRDQRNLGSSRGGRFSRNEDDRRHSGTPSKESDSYRRDRNRRYSNKQDRNEREGYHERRERRSSRDRKGWGSSERKDRRYFNEKEEERYSYTFSRDRNEREDNKSSKNRSESEELNEKEKRRNSKKSSSAREDDRSISPEESQVRGERVRGWRDEEDWGQSSESRADKERKSSRRSRDCEDSSEVRVKTELLSPEDRGDMSEWEDPPEDGMRLKTSPKDQEGDAGVSREESKIKKRSKRSRARSDSEDSQFERKSKKKKKKHSKKSSRNHESSDDSIEKKGKKKRKHKKSRD